MMPRRLTPTQVRRAKRLRDVIRLPVRGIARAFKVAPETMREALKNG